MNNRIKVILGSIVFIVFLIGADRLLKMQNGNSSNTDVEIKNKNGVGESNVLEVDSESFEKEVLESDKRVLIDFYATWCGPCKMLSPIIDNVSNERDDVKFVRIDVDKNEELASKYSIYQIPTLVIIENKNEIKRSTGLLSKEQLNEFINN